MYVPSVTASSMRPVFAVPPVRAVAAIARKPAAVEEVGREAPKDRVELSADAKQALAAAAGQAAATSFKAYSEGSIVSRTA